MQEEQNYGRSREPGDAMDGSLDGAGRPVGSTMSPQDERMWSMVAHLSVLAGLVGLAPFGALIVWLLYKERSPRVRFHALQALWYQIAWSVIFTVYVLVTVVVSIVTLGIAAIVLVPLAFLLALVPLAHGCYAAYKVNQGVDYRYPFIADRIDGGRRSL